MGDTWGADGPPSEAYERVPRDLAAVTAGFAAYLDELPTRLTREYDCELRDPTAEEIDRLPHSSSTEFDEIYAVSNLGAASARSWCWPAAGMRGAPS